MTKEWNAVIITYYQDNHGSISKHTPHIHTHSFSSCCPFKIPLYFSAFPSLYCAAYLRPLVSHLPLQIYSDPSPFFLGPWKAELGDTHPLPYTLPSGWFTWRMFRQKSNREWDHGIYSTASSLLSTSTTGYHPCHVVLPFKLPCLGPIDPHFPCSFRPGYLFPVKEMATHSSVLAWRSQGRGSLVGRRLWGRTESDTTEAT